MTTTRVLTGTERRRRWTAAEKARIVEQSLASGEVVALVARRYDVHPNLLHGWRRQARLCEASDRGLQFVPIEVTVRVGRQRPAASHAGAIEIAHEGVRICVEAGVDEAALTLVLRVLGR